MDKTRQALKLALEALEYIHEGANNQGPHTGISWRCVSKKAEPAITAIREALAEQPAPKWQGARFDSALHEQPAPPECQTEAEKTAFAFGWFKALEQKRKDEQPAQQPVTMDDAIAAGDSVLMNEQAALLRECRAALDSLIAQKPTLAGLLCGSATLGNLKAELYAYRPQGVFGASPQPAQQQEPVVECDCETATSPDGSRLTKCGSDQMRRAVEQGHAFCKQPAQQQEPVAWITHNGKGWLRWHKPEDNNIDSVPLYTSPQLSKPWVGLSTIELDEIDAPIRERGHATIAEIYRAIEAKLKERNT